MLETTIDGASGVLINITGGADMSMFEANTAADLIHSCADPNANIIFGIVIDEALDDEIVITVIATGFDKKNAEEAKGAGKESEGTVPKFEFSFGKKEEGQKAAAPDDDDISIPSFLKRPNLD